MFSLPVVCSAPNAFTLAALKELDGVFTPLYFGGKFSKCLKLSGLKQNFNAISVDFSLCFEILENADYFKKE